MPKRWHLTLTLVSIISGILLMSLIITNHAQRSDATEKPNADLIEIINRVEEETTLLEGRVDDRRKRIDTIREQRAVDVDQLSDFQGELSWLKKRTGLTQVEGPGVLVVLDDNEASAAKAKTTDPLSFDPGNYIIHDKDLLYLVNDLKIGGAEAIAINNQRVIASSDIRCVGTVVLVNSTRLAPPYEIRAIGDPEKLLLSITQGETFGWLQSRGFPIRAEIEDNLLLSTYKGSFSTNHLQSVKGDGSLDE